MADVSFLVGLEHLIGFIALSLGLVMLVWRLIDKQRKPIINLEKNVKDIRDTFNIEHERVQAQLADHEKRIDRRENHDASLWKAITEIKDSLHKLRAEMKDGQHDLSERLSRIEVGGCLPSKSSKLD